MLCESELMSCCWHLVYEVLASYAPISVVLKGSTFLDGTARTVPCAHALHCLMGISEHGTEDKRIMTASCLEHLFTLTPEIILWL